MRALTKITCVTLLSGLLAACAVGQNPDDPYESYNRKVFKFNYAVDKHVYRPVARAYTAVTPLFLQRGVTNFFYNVDQVPTIANDLLQLNIPWAAKDVARLAVNTTLGIGGFFDVAKHMGLERHDQDFGLTLAKWGVRQSPYLMVPFFAPYTARDFFGSFVDYYALSVWPYADPTWARYSLYGLNLLEERAALLPADKLVDQAFDPYVFMRDSYLQNRRSKVNKVLNPKGDGSETTSADDEAAINAAIAKGNIEDKQGLINPNSAVGQVRE